jgi:hypothetical protein
MAFGLLIVPLVRPGDLRAQDASPTAQIWANMMLGIPDHRVPSLSNTAIRSAGGM